MPISLTDQRPYAVYRWYRGEQLLYVGCTLDPAKRWARLAVDESWARLADRRSLCWYPNAAEALTAERSAIRDEHPLFNVDGGFARKNHGEVWREIVVDGEAIPLLLPASGGGWLIGEEEILRRWQAVEDFQRLEDERRDREIRHRCECGRDVSWAVTLGQMQRFPSLRRSAS